MSSCSISSCNNDNNSNISSPASQRTPPPPPVALVTGSSSGIGASVAIDLASRGFTVILTGRNWEKLTKVGQLCNDSSHNNNSDSGRSSGAINATAAKAIIYQVDFNSEQQLSGLVCFIRANFNKLDLLVNNVCWRGNRIKNVLADDFCDDLRETLHMNVIVPLRLLRDCCLGGGSSTQSRASAGSESEQDKKSIVINISSIAAQIAVPLHAYSISKACLSELSRQIALLDDDDTTHHGAGILSVTVSPGPVLTDERPHHAQMSSYTLMGRVATTQEISDLVMFLIDKAHLFNGQEINIDGGYMGKQKQP